MEIVSNLGIIAGQRRIKSKLLGKLVFDKAHYHILSSTNGDRRLALSLTLRSLIIETSNKNLAMNTFYQ